MALLPESAAKIHIFFVTTKLNLQKKSYSPYGICLNLSKFKQWQLRQG